MTLVEHLDELRTRIIVSAVVLVVAIGLCFWQNHCCSTIANEPLPGDHEPLTFSADRAVLHHPQALALRRRS